LSSSLSQQDIQSLNDILSIAKANPDIMSKDLANKLYQTVGINIINYSKSTKSSIKKQYNYKLSWFSNWYKCCNGCSRFKVYLFILFSDMSEGEKTQKVLDLKENIENVIGNNINNFNLTDPQLLGDSFMATQVTQLDDKSLNDTTKQAIENSLAIVNITDCIKKLKGYYNITQSLVLVKSDINTSFNTTLNLNKLVSFNIYNPVTNEKLNKSICNDMQIKTPIDDKQLNKTLYSFLRNDGIDVYNPDDKAFTSRCYSNIDPLTGYSTTLNYRIKNYFRNKSISCGNGCKYANTDANNYAVCQCSGATKTDSDFLNKIGDLFLTGFSNINIDLFLCYNQVLSVFINLYRITLLKMLAFILGLLCLS
jgi:hypothetical protein